MKKIGLLVVLIFFVGLSFGQGLIVNKQIGGVSEICTTDGLEIIVPQRVSTPILNGLSSVYDKSKYRFAFVVNSNGWDYDDELGSITDISLMPSVNIGHSQNKMLLSWEDIEDGDACGEVAVKVYLYCYNNSAEQYVNVETFNQIVLQVQQPPAPAIYGTTSLFQGQVETYHVPQVSGATYNWTVPYGWTIISGAGTHSIDVIAESARSGYVKCEIDQPGVESCKCPLEKKVGVDCWSSVVPHVRMEDAVSGDFDNDGFDDVAVMYDGGVGITKLFVWKGNQDGGFDFTGIQGWWSSSNYYDANMTQGRFVSGDFNNDGFDDVAAVYDYGTGAARIHVWESNGSGFDHPDINGWWSNAGWYDAGKLTGRVVAGDFNADGYDDIAGMYDYGTGQARIHLWESNGSSFGNLAISGAWASSAYYDANKVTDRLVAGNFDGYEGDDIIAVYDYGNGESRMHLWQSTGTSNMIFAGTTGRWVSASWYDANRISGRVVADDFDQDGDVDIAAMYDYTVSGNEARIHVWNNTGAAFFAHPNIEGWWKSEDGTVASNHLYDANNAFRKLVAGDFNGDDAPDLATFYEDQDGNLGRNVLEVFKGVTGTENGVTYYGGAFDYQGQNGWWVGCPYTGKSKSKSPLIDEELGALSELEISIVPNPTNDRATVKAEGIVSVRVFSMEGKELLFSDIRNDNGVEVRLNGFASGVYLVKVEDENGVISIDRLYKD